MIHLSESDIPSIMGWDRTKCGMRLRVTHVELSARRRRGGKRRVAVAGSEGVTADRRDADCEVCLAMTIVEEVHGD